MSDVDEEKIKSALKKKYEGRDEEITKYWAKKIDEEFKRRSKKNSIADDPSDYAKGRALGKQDPGYVSYKVPWQKTMLDNTGIAMPINTPYSCPVCGFVSMLEFPPERCGYCGTLSLIHMPTILKLKQ
jgi:hypothetical protein